MTWTLAIAFLLGLNLGFPLGWVWAGWLLRTSGQDGQNTDIEPLRSEGAMQTRGRHTHADSGGDPHGVCRPRLMVSQLAEVPGDYQLAQLMPDGSWRPYERGTD